MDERPAMPALAVGPRGRFGVEQDWAKVAGVVIFAASTRVALAASQLRAIQPQVGLPSCVAGAAGRIRCSRSAVRSESSNSILVALAT